MKGKLLLLITITSLLFTTASCNNGTDDKGPSSSSKAKLKMKINGKEWEATKNVAASVAFLSPTGTEDQVIVRGYLDNNAYLQITSGRNINGPGTYTLPSSEGGGLQFDNKDGKMYKAETLTLVITKINQKGSRKLVEGTFRGTAVNLIDSNDKITITEGEFDGGE